MHSSLPKAFDTAVRLLHPSDLLDRDLWNRLVDLSSCPDVYYRPAYVQAYEAAGHGQAAALLVDTGEGRVLIPILIRSISNPGFLTAPIALDGITAYGYGGLLLLEGLKELGVSQVRMLIEHIRVWCKQAGLVSLLVRLHPIFKQDEWLYQVTEETCRLRKGGQTTALRTSHWDDAARCVSTLAKGRRSDLNFARRNMQVTWASQRTTKDDDLKIFLDLYENRMDEVHASGFYHFPQAYYKVLFEGLSDRLDIAISWLGGEAVGASIFMADDQFAHYHLSATNELGRRNKAATLLINEGVKWARDRGCEYLHLGGGAKGEDSLLSFKKSFGGESFQYSFLTMITDSERYDALVHHQHLRGSQIAPLDPDFFPKYRA
jgi:GNAT superfamily N-acetyltransferase